MTEKIVVAGAGILGLWQALTLSRLGFSVRVVEASSAPFRNAASLYAGTMLAPDCEAEAADDLVRDLGKSGLDLWCRAYPQVVQRGSLVVAQPRDRNDLARFARMTRGHKRIGAARINELEPDLQNRFQEALYFREEAHVVTPDALEFLLNAVRRAGTNVEFGNTFAGEPEEAETVIDCRGIAARDQLHTLRGVRGERLLIESDEVRLTRPIRLIHPRHPLYVVPWGGGRYVVGATTLESEEGDSVSVRSALELLGAAYALHPAFGEAEIIDFGAGVRPAFADNIPRAIVRKKGKHILVNGAYRHGFLLAPVLAGAVANFLLHGTPHPLVVLEETAGSAGTIPLKSPT